MKTETLSAVSDADIVATSGALADAIAANTLRLRVGQLEKTHELSALKKQRARVLGEIRRREIAGGLERNELLRRHAAHQLSAQENSEAPSAEGGTEGAGEGLLASLKRRFLGGS